jgi:predicted PurR-regulated permease PerM
MNKHRKIIVVVLLLGVFFTGYWIVVNNRGQNTISTTTNQSSVVNDKSTANPVELQQAIEKLNDNLSKFAEKENFFSPSLLDNTNLNLE